MEWGQATLGKSNIHADLIRHSQKEDWKYERQIVLDTGSCWPIADGSLLGNFLRRMEKLGTKWQPCNVNWFDTSF